MAPWQTFATAEPELAAVGEGLLLLKTQYPAGLAYLATIRKDGGPRVHPFALMLTDGRLCGWVLKNSPKRNDLLRDSRCAVHSFPRMANEKELASDEEFYFTGRAMLINDPAIRQVVASATGDAVDVGDVFEFDLERVLHKGRRHGEAVYTTWKVR